MNGVQVFMSDNFMALSTTTLFAAPFIIYIYIYRPGDLSPCMPYTRLDAKPWLILRSTYFKALVMKMLHARCSITLQPAACGAMA